ncbi:MAG: RNA methyltransferase [Pseudomonadota bacterium]
MTDPSSPALPLSWPRSDTRFILIEASHPANVGAAARAMRVMGFSELVLVAPRLPDVLSHPQALAMASGATDVLQRARVVPTLTEALDGISFVCATAMTPRDFGPPTQTPRVCFEALAATDHRLGLVFGCERYGLSNEDVYRCHATLSIPTDPSYGSLNLAQAVQLLASEWRQACGGFEVRPRTAAPQWADAQAVSGLLAHWEQALVHIDFLQPQAPGKLLPRLNQCLNRLTLTAEEVHILRGVARAVLRTLPPPQQPDQGRE